MAFLSELATNASRQHVGVVIYSGNDDSLISHFSSEGRYQKLVVSTIRTDKNALQSSYRYASQHYIPSLRAQILVEYDFWRYTRLHEEAVDSLVR